MIAKLVEQLLEELGEDARREGLEEDDRGAQRERIGYHGEPAGE